MVVNGSRTSRAAASAEADKAKATQAAPENLKLNNLFYGKYSQINLRQSPNKVKLVI